VTTAAAAVRGRVNRFSVAVSPDLAALTSLALLSGLLAALTWGTWGDLGSDTGYDLVAGERVAQGDLPYADYQYFYGPLAPFLLGFAAWLGGGGLAPALGLGIALATLIVFGAYALARVQTGALGAFLAGAITAAVGFGPSNFSFVLPHTYSATLGLAAALGVLLAAASYARAGAPAWLAAAGTAAGLVALTRPEFAVAVLAAAVAWLVVRRRAGGGTRREWVLFGVPAVVVPAVVYGAFLLAVSPGRLVFDNLYPVDELRAGGSEILRLHAPLTASSFVDLGGKLVLYALGVAVLLGVARVLGRLELPRMNAAAVLAGAAIAGIALLARPETLRYGLEFAYGWVPAGAVLALVVLAWWTRRSREPVSPAFQAAFGTTVILALLAAKTYAAFFFHSTVPQLAVYAAPFVALFLVRLHLVDLPRLARSAYVLGAAWLAFLGAAGVGLTLRAAGDDSARVHGPGGTLATTPHEALLYEGALAWIARESRPGDSILLAPQLTALYALSDREDPLPQISLLPGALPAVADERRAIAELERADVRLVVVDKRSFPEYGHTTFGGSFDRTLNDWIRSTFTKAATLGSADGPRTFEIWLRRP
jgi:hypothetical protein